MLNKFRFEEAEKALNLVLHKDASGDIDTKLEEAKKVYDFLIGMSRHFKNSET